MFSLILISISIPIPFAMSISILDPVIFLSLFFFFYRFVAICDLKSLFLFTKWTAGKGVVLKGITHRHTLNSNRQKIWIYIYYVIQSPENSKISFVQNLAEFFIFIFGFQICSHQCGAFAEPIVLI